MCGFYLEISEDRQYPISSYMGSNMHLHRRGPDSKKVIDGENWRGEFYRLAIVSEVGIGEQPIKINDEKYLFFNGEIYNWKALIPQGMEINSDSECLAYLIHKNGFESAIKSLQGMYAIALFDTETRNLKIARDFPGIKPLYYYNNTKKIIVSSDVTSISSKLDLGFDQSRMSEYLAFRSVLSPQTIYKGVKQCPPGTIVSFRLDKGNSYNETKNSFFNIKDKFANLKVSHEDLHDVLKDSIILQSKSIHDPSTLLSSGIDSGLIAKFLLDECEELKAFSIFFNDPRFSERSDIENDWANKNIDINFILDESSDNDEDLIYDYMKFKGSPITIGNEVSLLKLFSVVKKSTPVILSGEGADELFLGYDRIVKHLHDWNHEGLQASELIDKFLAKYFYISPEQINSKFELSEIFDTIKSSMMSVYKEFGWEKTFQYFFLKYHIPSLLDRLDKTSMYRSVEARVPFLNQTVVEFALGHELGNPLINSNQRYIGKKILREVAINLMGENFGLRSKIGFPHPVYSGASKQNQQYGKNGWISDQLDIFTSH